MDPQRSIKSVSLLWKKTKKNRCAFWTVRLAPPEGKRVGKGKIERRLYDG